MAALIKMVANKGEQSWLVGNRDLCLAGFPTLPSLRSASGNKPLASLRSAAGISFSVRPFAHPSEYSTMTCDVRDCGGEGVAPRKSPYPLFCFASHLLSYSSRMFNLA
jgi:hypothetical protein